MGYSFRRLQRKIRKIAITNAFQENLDETNRIPNKICLNKAFTFCNRSMKSGLE